MHEHSRRGNMGLLVVLRFVATTDFDHVVFELGCKMVVEKLNITCEDHTELGKYCC